MGERSRSEPTPADRRRPAPTDGVLTRLRWYAWVLYEYAKMFAIGAIAVGLSVLAAAAANTVFVPEFVSEPTYGWLFTAWSLASLAVFIMWGKGRMARTGIERR